MRLEGAVAISQKHSDLVVIQIADNDVERTIAVDIAGRKCRGMIASRILLMARERAVAIAQQDCDFALKLIDGCDINFPVTIEVAGQDRDRMSRNWVFHVSREG